MVYLQFIYQEALHLQTPNVLQYFKIPSDFINNTCLKFLSNNNLLNKKKFSKIIDFIEVIVYHT